jgi:hypothetical protein
MILDSLSLKIRSFLATAGFEIDPSIRSATDLVRYFEEEYDLDILGFLEQEWVGEQIERDVVFGPLSGIRESAADEPDKEDD